MSKAKQFIIENSEKFRDAVENGYSITMDESEILLWMELYRNTSLKRVQLCPKCLGEKEIEVINIYSTSSCTYRTCPTCGGTGIFII